MTDHYAVIGNPISHSKSPKIHTMFANQTNQDMDYVAIKAEPGEFSDTVKNFVANQGSGLNVTLPFKQDAFRFANVLSDQARRSGAVNTLVVKQGGEIFGDNTDGTGLIRDLEKNLNITVGKLRVLVLGAGGAVRGILPSLIEKNPSSITLANRTEIKAFELADLFEELYSITPCHFKALNGRKYDLIINGTSASVSNELPPIPNGILESGGYCYDLMYAEQDTAFVKWGQEQGAFLSSDGLGMLVEQAAESFYLWRQVRPETSLVIKSLKTQMQQSF